MKLFKLKYLSLSLLLIFTLSGCKKEEPQIVNTPNVSINSIEDTQFVVSDTNKKDPAFEGIDFTNTLDPYSLSKEEIDSLPILEIKKIVAMYTSDFRKSYSIDKNKELTGEDWESIRFILEYQLFGKEIFQHEVSENSIEDFYKELGTDQEIIDEIPDEAKKYVMPTSKYIASLTLDEFRDWLTNAYAYYDSDDIEYVINDLSEIPDEDMKRYQDNYVKELQELEQSLISQSVSSNSIAN